MAKPLPSIEYLRECVSYDPVTGQLRWLHRPEHHFALRRVGLAWNTKHAGTLVQRGCAGYIVLSLVVDGKKQQYRAHRVAWALMTGEWPTIDIDHRNTVRSDNRWTNLRLATPLQNIWNRGVDRRNTSGFKGVHPHTQQPGRWVAQIRVGGRAKHLGSFSDPAAAAAAYQTAQAQVQGQFARA